MNEYKSIVHNKKNPMWFDQDFNMNLYIGCNHKCIYCDSMSDCYGLTNFHKVNLKKDALKIVYKDLKSKVKKGVIATGSMSDPYNHLESKELATRKSLEMIRNFGFGIFITTKSDLILRDLDILLEIKKYAPVLVGITITSFNDELSKKVEPNAPISSKRFETLKVLSKNNIFSGIMLMPVLPFIEDNKDNINNILNKAYEIKTNFVFSFFGVTLRDTQREYFYKKLDEEFPNLKEKYINTFKNNYYCNSQNSNELTKILKTFCEEKNILYKMEDIVCNYKKDYEDTQQKLF